MVIEPGQDLTGFPPQHLPPPPPPQGQQQGFPGGGANPLYMLPPGEGGPPPGEGDPEGYSDYVPPPHGSPGGPEGQHAEGHTGWMGNHRPPEAFE